MKPTKHFFAAFCILPSSFFLLFSWDLGLGIWNLGLGTCFAQPAYTWANSIGSTTATTDDEGHSVAVDGSGNVYIIGYFGTSGFAGGNTADFNPGAGTANLSTTNNYPDIYVAKYNSAGAYIWAFRIGGTARDWGYDIAVDGNGNVLVTGSFQGTVDFDPGAGTANLISVGGVDVFVAKYTTAGAYLWAFLLGSGSLYIPEKRSAIAVDGSGNVLVTGWFTGTADFNPSGATNNLTSAGWTDIFVAKYTSAGAYLWAFRVGSTDYDYGYGIAVDGSGNVLVTGEFRGTADFDPGAGTANLISAGNSDIFVAKYTSAGNYLWAFQIGTTNPDWGYDVAVDGSGNVLVTGGFGIRDGFLGGGTADFDPGAGTANLSTPNTYPDIFVAKYTSAGTYLWAFRIGSTSTNTISDFGYSVAVDGSGIVYITGSYVGTVDFDPGAGTANLISPGFSQQDIFVAKYTSAGNYLCAGSMGGANGGNEIGYGIAVDGSGNAFVIGFFGSAPADFDPGAGTANLSSAGTGNRDIFFAKYGQCSGFTATQFCVAVGGAAGDDIGNSIVQTSDGGYAVAGYTTSFGQGSNDVYVVKLDGSGTVQWTRTVGGASSDVGYSIVQTADGGYAVAGNTSSYGAGVSDVYVVKLDGSGTVLWTRTVGGAGDERGYSIVQTADGGYAVAGSTNSYGAGGNDVYVVKFDGNGTVQWTRTVGGAHAFGDGGNSIVQTSDGGYAIAGGTYSYGAGGQDMYVVKLDGSGTVLWTRTVGGASGEGSFAIVQTSDGGYALAGGTLSYGAGFNEVYVMKLDGSGTVLWTRTVGGAVSDFSYSIVQTSDGGLALAGSTNSYGAGGSDVYVVKLDGSGTVLWTRTFGGSGTDEGKSIVQTSDGGFAVAGSTSSFGSGGNDVYIIKIAP